MSLDNTLYRFINPLLSKTLMVTLISIACCRIFSVIWGVVGGVVRVLSTADVVADGLLEVGVEVCVLPKLADGFDCCAWSSVFSPEDNGWVSSV